MRGGVAPPPPPDESSKPGRTLTIDPPFLTSRLLPSPSPPGLTLAVDDPWSFTVALPRPASLGSPRRPGKDASLAGMAGMGGPAALFGGCSSGIELVSATRESPRAAGTGAAATSATTATGARLDGCVWRAGRCRVLSAPNLGRTKTLVTC